MRISGPKTDELTRSRRSLNDEELHIALHQILLGCLLKVVLLEDYRLIARRNDLESYACEKL
jgi:hypothetical protein